MTADTGFDKGYLTRDEFLVLTLRLAANAYYAGNQELTERRIVAARQMGFDWDDLFNELLGQLGRAIASEVPAPSLCVADIAERAGCSDHHIRNLARRGQIPHYRIGAAIRFDPDEIGAWFESRHIVPQPEAQHDAVGDDR